MTQEEKSLLLQDLCARLPYGVKVYTDAYCKPVTLGGYYNYRANEFYFTEPEFWLEIQYFKPYLRPMSSMTVEECIEFGDIDATFDRIINIIPNVPYYFEVAKPEQIDWLNAHHFDYRGLIEKGLALVAPKGMY